MGKKIHNSAKFERHFEKLSRKDKEETFELIYELPLWPNLPSGRRAEKIIDMPEGPLYSMRVSHHIRILVQVLEDGSFYFSDIGPHDEVYKGI